MPNRKQFRDKESYNAWMREYRKRNAEKFRNYNREYNKKWRKENGYYIENKSKKKYPEKEYARKLLHKAIRQGLIKRGLCEECAKPNAQAHHDDYFKPLEVRWFCPLHHRKYHKHLGDSS